MELSPEGSAGAGFRLRPFSLPAGARTFQFLTGWISRLLSIGGWKLSGEDPSEIRARVEDLYAFAPQRRTLGVLVRSLPAKMWPALGRWHGAGAWARYFDNPADGDDLNFQDWQVIDMAGAAEHEDLCEAALFYLLERLRLSLENPDETARVKLMVVDEAWRYLKDPAVLSYLAEAAKTWRLGQFGPIPQRLLSLTLLSCSHRHGSILNQTFSLGNGLVPLGHFRHRLLGHCCPEAMVRTV